MRILVVDDSKAMRLIVVRTLHLAGYAEHEIVQADNGRAAIDVINATPPDLVLCDWNMPVMSGLDLLNALRGAGWQVPFGFVTSEGSPQMRQQAFEAGAMCFIAKPFTPEDVQEALDPLLAD